MPAWLLKILVALAMEILKEGFAEGTEAAEKYKALKKTYDADVEAAKKYRETINKPGSTREDRRHAEDDLLS